jgi:protein gp37
MNKTKIEWADATWNPITGCTKISPGCANCYAEKMSKRLAGRCGYPADEPFKVTIHPDKIDEPLKWKKPRRVFVCSMSDLFHKDVPMSIITYVLRMARSCEGHTFMILTKRPARMKEAIREMVSWGMWPVPNIWLGVTAENQEQADERIPILLDTPAAVRFVSVEPMLGPVELSPWIRRYYHGGKPRMKEGAYLLPPSKTGKSTLLQYAKQIDPNCVQRADRVYLTTDYMSALMFAMGYPNGEVYRAIPDLPLEEDPDCTEKGLSFQTPQALITSMSAPILDWVIAGGESGPGARPCHPDWIRSVRDQCQGAGVPYFFKQWGEWVPMGSEFGQPNSWSSRKWQQRVDDWRPGWDGMPWYDGNGHSMIKVGKKAAGRLLDGREWSEFPS